MDFAGSEFVLLGAAPAGGVPGGVLASLGVLPLDGGDIDPDMDDEPVPPGDGMGAVLEPVDPPDIPDVPLADPEGPLLPPVVFDMLEPSVLGVGGSFF